MNVIKKSLLVYTALLWGMQTSWGMEDLPQKTIKMSLKRHLQKGLQGEDQQVTNDKQKAIEIPEEFLISFMRDALHLSRTPLPAVIKTEIKEDLVEGPDNKDYIRLLNMKFLFERRRPDFDVQQQFHWLVNLSRQVDALNIHDGSLREMITPANNDGMFWRRLSYLHHGLTNQDLNPNVRNYIIEQLWKSDDLHNLGILINAFFKHNIFKLRSESLQIRNTWLERIVKVLAWPSLVPFSWLSSNIPLSERIKNFHTLLKKYDPKDSLEDYSEDTDKNEYMMIHPYLKGNNHPEHEVKIFGKTLQTIKRRAHEINRETYDRDKALCLIEERKIIKKKEADLQNKLRALNKRKAASIEEEEEIKKEKETIKKCIRDLKEEYSKKEDSSLLMNHKIDVHVMELVDDFEKFGAAQLESHSQKFKDFYQNIANLTFTNTSFYVGLLNEFEHLNIANNYLVKMLSNFAPNEHESIFQGIAVTAEALNNVILPLEQSEEIKPIKEVLKFFRNKIIEHKTNLAKRKLNQLYTYPEVDNIFNALRKDLELIQEKIFLRFNRLEHIVKGDTNWEVSIEELKKSFPLKFPEIEDVEWQDWGIPTLSGLMRYFIYNSVTPEEILIQERSQVEEMRKKVKAENLKRSKTDKDKDETEASTLNELRLQTKEMSSLIEIHPSIEELRNQLEHDLNFRLKFFRILNDIKESFGYLSENMEEEYLSQVLSVFEEQVLWHLYYDLRDRRNLTTHDLWRNDINGLISTALRIQNILNPAVTRNTQQKYYLNPGKDLEATKQLFKFIRKPFAMNSEDEICKLIDLSQADVNGIDLKGHTPLFYAITAKNKRLVKLLLQRKANPNALINRQGDTALHLASRDYKQSIVRLLLEHDALTDTRNAQGETPYRIVLNSMSELSNRNFPRFQLPDLKKQDTPYQILELLKREQSYQRGLEADQLHTSIRLASSSAVKEKLSQLIEEGHDVNLYDEHGEIPLCLALGRRFTSEDSSMLLLLLLNSNNIDLHLKNYIGIQESVLHLAAQRKSLEPAQLLIQHITNPSLPNAEGTTPLHYAVGLRNVALARFLLESGANIHAQDYLGLTPILVSANSQLDMLELLLQKGANPNDRDELGETLLERVEGMLGGESLNTGDIVSALQARQLLFQYGAYPIVRMTPYVFNTISYTLNYWHLRPNIRKTVFTSALQELSETYNFISGSTRLHKYLLSRGLFSAASQIEAEKNELIRKKIKEYKKFIYVIGPSSIQNRIAQSMSSVINNASINENERKKFLQLIPSYEDTIADVETESLQTLAPLYNDLLQEQSHNNSSSKKSFLRDLDVTQKLLWPLLRDSIGLDNRFSNEEILNYMAINLSAGYQRLRKFMVDRETFSAHLASKQPSHRPQYFYFKGTDQIFYFGYSEKYYQLLLRKFEFFSHHPSVRELISRDKGILGKNTLETISHAWRPYGNQAQLQLWNADPLTRQLIPCEVIGPQSANDVLHFLKVDEQEDVPEHYIPLDEMEYTYTAQDIRHIIQLNILERLDPERILRFGINERDQLYQLSQDELFHERVIYQIDNKLILPPAEDNPGFKLEEYAQNHVKKMQAGKLFNHCTSEIIIPYNPGGHWVTIYARITNGELLISYIDSLRHQAPELENIRKDIIINNLQNLKRILKQAYRLKASEDKKEVGKIEVVYPRLQEGNHDCGVLTLENIISLAKGETQHSSGAPTLFNYTEINTLRAQHHQRLLKQGLNLSFDTELTRPCLVQDKPHLKLSKPGKINSAPLISIKPLNDASETLDDAPVVVISKASSSTASTSSSIMDSLASYYEPDTLGEYDYKTLSIGYRPGIEELPVRAQPLNPTGGLQEAYEIDGKRFRRQNVEGTAMRCFFNAAGLEAEMEIAKLKSKQNDPIVRYIIANEILSASANPEQLPRQVKDAIDYTTYQIKRADLNEREEQRNTFLANNPGQDLPIELQTTGQTDAIIREELRGRALSLHAFHSFLDYHIGGEQMMVTFHDVEGEVGDNPNANYASVDAIAYINNLGIKIYRPHFISYTDDSGVTIYRPDKSKPLHLTHKFIPEEATEVVYVYHEGDHFEALIPDEVVTSSMDS